MDSKTEKLLKLLKTKKSAFRRISGVSNLVTKTRIDTYHKYSTSKSFVKGYSAALILAVFLFLLGFCLAENALAAPGAWVAGKYGTAYDFNGSGYVSCGNVSGGIKTISFWLKADNTTQKILDLNGTDYVQVSAGTITATGAGWGSPTIYVDGNAASIIDTNWHHIVITNTVGVNGSAVYLGFVGVGGSYYFDGILDDVRFYSYVRTADEILQDYNEGMALRFGEDGNLASLMTKGLVGYWGMGEGAGQYAYDGSGNNNTGTLGSGSNPDSSDPTWTTGKVGGALSFDGVNDYVNAGTAASLNITGSELTLEAWVKISSWAGMGGYAAIVENYQDVAGNGGYLIERESTNNWLLFGLWSAAGFKGCYSTTAPLVENTWYHIAGVFNGTSMILYLNASPRKTDTFAATTIASSSNPVVIGGRTAVGHNFNGTIDEPRIYNRALSAEEIRYHYNRGRPVAQWRFDEGSGQIAFDESDNNNDGYLGGTSAVETTDPTWTSGQYNTALSFDGNDYVDAGNGASLQMGTGNFSVSFWMKTTQTEINRDIISHQNTGSPYVGWLIRMNSATNTGKVYFRYSVVGSINQEFPSNTVVNDNKWHHILCKLDTNTTYIYIDGKYDNSMVVTTGSINSGVSLQFGYGLGYFNGLIDDVRIYNYARSAEEIRVDYNNGLSTHFK